MSERMMFTIHIRAFRLVRANLTLGRRLYASAMHLNTRTPRPRVLVGRLIRVAGGSSNGR
jgi:hypothetical protein